MRHHLHIFLGVVVLWAAGCQAAPPAPSATPMLPTLAAVRPTQTTTSTSLPQPTLTPSPLPTHTPPRPPTAVPTHTHTPPPPSPVAAATSDRTCPDPPPDKPVYQHNVLSPEPWPTPDTAVLPHSWLADPVSGGRKPLANGYYPYGWDGDGRFLLHNGADMPKELGTPVTAVANGTVIVAQADDTELYGWRCDWYGQLVVVELDERWQGQPVYVLYGHIQAIQVEPGQHVGPGDPLAEIGVAGVSTVPHLHLEIRVGSNDFSRTRNPLLWLAPVPETGVLAGRLVNSEGRPWQGARVTLIDASGSEPRYLYTFTYLDDPQHLIHPDEGLAENFVFADLPSGSYTLFATVQGVEYRLPVEVQAGEVTAVDIVTEPAASQP